MNYTVDNKKTLKTKTARFPNNNDVIQDKTRKCGTCGSLALVGFDFCTDCGDFNIVPRQS